MRPRTVAGLLRERAGSRLRDRLAVRFLEGGDWTAWTWGQFWEAVHDAASGLAGAGVRPGDRVLVLVLATGY
jgi:acyl-CoA synthetase (AMP-forming)/AMP-acid ligase II